MGASFLPIHLPSTAKTWQSIIPWEGITPPWTGRIWCNWNRNFANKVALLVGETFCYRRYGTPLTLIDHTVQMNDYVVYVRGLNLRMSTTGWTITVCRLLCAINYEIKHIIHHNGLTRYVRFQPLLALTGNIIYGSGEECRPPLFRASLVMMRSVFWTRLLGNNEKCFFWTRPWRKEQS